MKKIVLLFAVAGLLSFSSVYAGQGGPDKFVGTWNISVPDAPIPDYSSSQLVFVKEGNTIKGSIGMNEYMKMDVEDLVIKGKEATFVIYIMGEKITINIKRKGTTLLGTASYSQGVLTVKGTKQ